jgi:Cu/Ag efflux pump CusA
MINSVNIFILTLTLFNKKLISGLSYIKILSLEKKTLSRLTVINLQAYLNIEEKSPIRSSSNIFVFLSYIYMIYYHKFLIIVLKPDSGILT